MLARRIAVLVVVGLLGCGPQPDWHTEHAKQWQRWNQIKVASQIEKGECDGCGPRFGETKSVKSDRLSREAREYLRRIEQNTRGLREIQALTAQPVLSQEVALEVWSDPQAKYWVLSNVPIGLHYRVITTRRVGPSGESFAVRLTRCSHAEPMFAYIGDSNRFETAQAQAQEALKQGVLTIQLSGLVTGSISDIVVRAACGWK